MWMVRLINNDYYYYYNNIVHGQILEGKLIVTVIIVRSDNNQASQPHDHFHFQEKYVFARLINFE